MNPPNTPTPDNASQPESDYLSIRDRLNGYKVALTNARNAAILPYLQNVGYVAADITARLADVERARQTNEDQVREYGEYSAAQAAYDAACATAHRDYIKHIGLARLKFRRDKGALIALDVVGERAEAQGEYVLEALNFYNNGQKPAYQPGLASKGMTAVVLQAGSTAYLNLQTLLANIKKEGGEAQGATQTRNRTLALLEDWMVEFTGSARIALEGQGQLMEQMGMTENSVNF